MGELGYVVVKANYKFIKLQTSIALLCNAMHKRVITSDKNSLYTTLPLSVLNCFQMF